MTELLADVVAASIVTNIAAIIRIDTNNNEGNNKSDSSNDNESVHHQDTDVPTESHVTTLLGTEVVPSIVTF